MRRTQPITKEAKISSSTHVHWLQWLHGKQQQHGPHLVEEGNLANRPPRPPPTFPSSF